MVFHPGNCPVCSREQPSSDCPIASHWMNEDRMDFLTSKVSPDEADALADMSGFWTSAVTHAFEEARTLSVDLGVLSKTTLAWHGATCSGLTSALCAMISNGDLIPADQVITGLASRLMRALVIKPALYGLSFVWTSGGDEVLAGEYVHRQVLEGVAKKLSKFCQDLPEKERTVVISSSSNSHCSLEHLCRQAAAATVPPPGGTANDGATNHMSTSLRRGGVAILGAISGSDLELLVDYMVQTRRALREGRVVKFLGGREGRVLGAGSTVARITEGDKDLLLVRCTVANLEGEVMQLQARMAICLQEALRAKGQGQKQVAAMHMRRRKALEGALSSRAGSLAKLDHVLEKVASLGVDKQVLEAHEVATRALRNFREESNLSVERVEDAIDNLAEEMESLEAVGSTLGQLGSQGQVTVEDSKEMAELEKELAELEEQEVTKENPAVTPVGQPLPAVPTGVPGGLALGLGLGVVSGEGDSEAEKGVLQHQLEGRSHLPNRVLLPS
ncbi:unnamed protein product [Discosporangium mesarthrocarpum]